MIIKNFGKKTKIRRRNMFRGFKIFKKLKIFNRPIEKIYAPVIAVLCVLFISGAMLFTPVDKILSEALYTSVFSKFTKIDVVTASESDINAGDILLGLISGNLHNLEILNKLDISELMLTLSYPMIRVADIGGQLSASSSNIAESDVNAPIEEDITNDGSAYRNMPIVNDEPIISIYEHYENASGAKIEEVGDIDSETANKVPDDAFRITPVNFSGQKNSVPQLLLSNQTSFNIDLNDFIRLRYPIRDSDISSSEPVVLILCTHATESYCETGKFYYSPAFTAERTSDINKNVVLIASELKSALEQNGIPVIQSLKLHDEVSYQNSYIRSLETMNAYVKQYPSIRYIIDVHRDSIIVNTGEKYKPTININGKNAAQLMMVIGTSDGGANHPNWTENLTFATHMQQKLNDKYPMLARPINLRSARFNQHVTKGSIILEVGSCGSSFDEALYSARLFGECLAELIIENSGDSVIGWNRDTVDEEQQKQPKEKT